ncbi:NADH:ubiquinone oxidoreductase, NDUFS5-15kDa, partial [Halocaridina rubra]
RLTEKMAHTYGPVFRTPFTDLSSTFLTHQAADKCNNFEMNYVKCIEAYGMGKGEARCRDYMDDLRECQLQLKQIARVKAMRFERHRQWATGERSSEDHYAPAARIDGF